MTTRAKTAMAMLAGIAALAAAPRVAHAQTKATAPAAAAKSAAQAATPAKAPVFRLSSADVKGGAFANAQIFNDFGCNGGNVSPQLAWSNPPDGTKSFVLSIYDPDAPTGSGFWHWVVINIPAAARQVPNGASRNAAKMPAGSLETRTDFGAPGYGGPCPPAGDPPHRYIFTVTALKVDKLDLDAGASGAMVGFNVHSNTLGRATFTAKYGR